MKLVSVQYHSDDNEWKSLEYLPCNSRYILVHSPEFGTSIGYYDKEISRFIDLLRLEELVGITHWRELPRYVAHNSDI